MDTTPLLATINTIATAIGTLYCFALAVIIAGRGIHTYFEGTVFAACITLVFYSLTLWVGDAWKIIPQHHIPGVFAISTYTLLALLPFTLYTRRLTIAPLAIILLGITNAILITIPGVFYERAIYSEEGFIVLTPGPFNIAFLLTIATLVILPLAIYAKHLHQASTHNLRIITYTLLIGQSILGIYVLTSSLLLPILFHNSSLIIYNPLIGTLAISVCFTIAVLRRHHVT